jgi:hypothetical protein
MNSAPKLPTNVIKDTDIIFNNILLKSSPFMCIEHNTINKFYTYNCNYSINQQYIYNPIKKQLKEKNTNNCLDIDTNNNITWSPCDEYNVNQQYNYNINTNQIINPNNKLCVDLSTSKLNTCTNNKSQKFIGEKSVNEIYEKITENNNTILRFFNTATELNNIYSEYYTNLANITQNYDRKFRVIGGSFYEQGYILWKNRRDLTNNIVIDISKNLNELTKAKNDSNSALTTILNSNVDTIMLNEIYKKSNSSFNSANNIYNNIIKYNDYSIYKNY